MMAGEEQHKTKKKERSKLMMARLEAGLSPQQLADLAEVARGTLKNAEKGIPVRDINAYRIVTAINTLLPEHKHLTLDDLRITGEDDDDSQEKDQK